MWLLLQWLLVLIAVIAWLVVAIRMGLGVALLFLLTAVNAWLSNDVVISRELRTSIVSFPVNVYDLMLVGGLLLTLLPKSGAYFRVERGHPLFPWVVGLFVVGALGAGIGASTNGATDRQLVGTLRNFLSMPAAIYLGYRLIPRPKAATTLCHFLVLVGLVTSVIILLNFGEQSSDLQTTTDVLSVRVVQYVSSYAGIAAALLVFSVGWGGKPIFRWRWLALALASICFVGQFATLSRSDWLALIAGIFAAVAIMPRYRLRTKLLFTAVVTPLMLAVLWGAIYVASAVSGRDVYARMVIRIESTLPGEYEGVKKKAWDSRMEGAIEEIKLWSRSPLIGRGFGIQDTQVGTEAYQGGSFRHNTWTSTLAESGLIGFGAMAAVCIGQVVIGRRMVKDRLERGAVLMGALGVITGVHYTVLGYCTMSFNLMRWAIPLGLTFGAVLRCRAMELAVARQYAGYLPDKQQQAEQLAPLLDETCAEIRPVF